MAEEFKVRSPIAFADGVTDTTYRVRHDYGDTDTESGGMARDTLLEVDAASDGSPLATLVPLFPGFCWFIPRGGAANTGDLILELEARLGATFSADLEDRRMDCPWFLAYCGVTLTPDTWKTSYNSWLVKVKNYNFRYYAGHIDAYTGKSKDEIFADFLNGTVPIRTIDGPLPIGSTTGQPQRLRLLLGKLNPPDVTVRNISLQEFGRVLKQWFAVAGNANKRIHEHDRVTAIPLGHFFSQVHKDFWASSAHAEHPLVAKLVDAPTNWFSGAIDRLYDGLGIKPKWRRLVLSSNRTPHYYPAVWPGWTAYDITVRGKSQHVPVSGVTYWRVTDGNSTVAIASTGGGGKLKIRRLFERSFVDQRAFDIQSPLVPVIAELPDPTFLVKPVGSPTSPGYTHQSPLDLDSEPGADNTAPHAVYAIVGGQPIHALCTGFNTNGWMPHVMKYVDDPKQPGTGLGEYGYRHPSRVLTERAAEFQALQWDQSQLHVLGAVADNEAMCDGLNTWDSAYLTVGMLQWTIYTNGEKRGELPAFIEYLKAVAPTIYDEYFGQFQIGSTNVEPWLGRTTPPKRPADWVPRGYLTISGTSFDETADKNVMRRYEWSLLFQSAMRDPDCQALQLRFGHERLSIVRDYDVILPAQAAPLGKVKDLFTCEYSVALIVDHHTNNPQAVAPNLGAHIGARRPGSNGAFSEADRLAIMAAYGPARVMSDVTTRFKKIKKRMDKGDLRTADNSFVWPTVLANSWLPPRPPP